MLLRFLLEYYGFFHFLYRGRGEGVIKYDENSVKVIQFQFFFELKPSQ